MENVVTLRDGTKVVIRPMVKDDLERSLSFFKALSPEDRAYLRRDVTNPAVVEQRIREMEVNKVGRLVAVFEDKIIADGALEREGYGWKEHVGELRLIIAPEFQRKGLGMLLARELYFLAAQSNLEEIVVRMMGPQAAALSIFKRLGFVEKATLRDYVKDRKGIKQDLVIMRCDLKSMWRELQDFLEQSDWGRSR